MFKRRLLSGVATLALFLFLGGVAEKFGASRDWLPVLFGAALSFFTVRTDGLNSKSLVAIGFVFAFLFLLVPDPHLPYRPTSRNVSLHSLFGGLFGISVGLYIRLSVVRFWGQRENEA